MLSVTQVEVVSPSSANEAGLGVGTSAEVQYEETDDGHGFVPTPHRIARFPPPVTRAHTHDRHAGRQEERQPAVIVIPLALAASRIRACMQQDATGSLGTCVHKRMRACQHMLRSAGEKGGSAADTLSTHQHLSTCPRRTGLCTSRQMMK